MVSFIIFLIVAILIIFVANYMRILYKHFETAKVTVGSIDSNQSIKKYAQAPGPFPMPIFGNLTLLRQYQVPFQAFTELSKEFGDIYSLTLGTTRCLVINNLELIRDVLNQNGKFFGARPDFLRYHKLFGGDRNNSLALCDWSTLQQKRRNLARRHCSPRDSSSYFTKMSNVGCSEVYELLNKLEETIVPGQPLEIKPLIQQACANMFSQYMCSVRFNYADVEFQRIVYYFDEIFWEINQGYALDFLPWLAPFYRKHLNKIINWSSSIRKFILERVINNREQNIDLDEPEKDFTDALLKNLAENKNVSRDTIIYMLEDFIGGHSAVGNLVMLCLAYIVKYPHVGKKIQAEIDATCRHQKRQISLYDMEYMPFTLATIFEVLRFSSSPIVPHVATEDTVIANHGITSGTIVFINNYKLNTSEKYWTKPELFDPERFLEQTPNASNKHNLNKSIVKRRNSESSDSGIELEKDSNKSSLLLTDIAKPTNNTNNTNNFDLDYKIRVKKNIPHFLPFSIGKRTCIGQNLVRGFGFILLANILKTFEVTTNDILSIEINPACVALPAKTFKLILKNRFQN